MGPKLTQAEGFGLGVELTCSNLPEQLMCMV